MLGKKDKIKNIFARQILDSRGAPTLEVAVFTLGGAVGRAAVPSGASTGKKEAVELRDKKVEYFGKGVMLACENVNTEISGRLKNISVTDQSGIDKLLVEADGTPARSRLGGNSLIGVSMACARAAANLENLPLYKYLAKISHLKLKEKMPVPMLNLINGGLHAGNSLDIQEYLFIPKGKKMAEALRMAAEVYHALGALLSKRGLSTGVGDEGGFAPELRRNSEPFNLIIEAAQSAGFKLDQDYGLGIDAAANSFLQNNNPFQYQLTLENELLSSMALIDLYEKWIDDYKLISIEDGLAEDDLEGWQQMTKILSEKAHVVGRGLEIIGDDLFVTSAKRLIDGIERKLATAVIIKPSQVGTVSETIETVRIAKQHNYACVASHRSGDTPDAFIADLAVGLACEYIKAGAPARGERVAKYNRLLEIEEELGSV